MLLDIHCRKKNKKNKLNVFDFSCKDCEDTILPFCKHQRVISYMTLQENQERHLLEEKAEERRRLRAQQMNAKQHSRRMSSL